MSKLTDRTKFMIAKSAVTGTTSREGHVLTRLISQHKLDKGTQNFIAHATRGHHHQVYSALLDHQHDLHPHALWYMAMHSNNPSRIHPNQRDDLQERIFSHPNVNDEVLHEFAGNPRFHSRLLEHPLTSDDTKAAVAKSIDFQAKNQLRLNKLAGK